MCYTIKEYISERRSGGLTAENIKKSKKETSDDHLNWRYQDKTYNELFKKWRRQSKDSMGFYYVNNPNELTYRDGYGFVRNYPEAAEAHALRNVFNLIGVTMLLVAALDIVSMYLLPMLLTRLGADIYYDSYTGIYYGNEWLILALNSSFEILKRLLPLLYCYSRLQMPLKVMIPVKVTNKPLFRSAAHVMLMVSGTGVVLSEIFRHMLGAVHIQPAEWVRLPEETAPLIVSLVINIIIVPVISEFYTRGAIMQLLRQFGDGFAIIITAVLTAFITYNSHQFCYVFVCSLIIGYFAVRTGSVMTAAIMRVVSRVIFYGLYIIDCYLDPSLGREIAMAVVFLAVMVGLISLISLMINHSDKFGMKFSSRYLSFTEKCLTALTSVPVVMGVSVMVILMVVKTKIIL